MVNAGLHGYAEMDEILSREKRDGSGGRVSKFISNYTYVTGNNTIHLYKPPGPSMIVTHLTLERGSEFLAGARRLSDNRRVVPAELDGPECPGLSSLTPAEEKRRERSVPDSSSNGGGKRHDDGSDLAVGNGWRSSGSSWAQRGCASTGDAAG